MKNQDLLVDAMALAAELRDDGNFLNVIYLPISNGLILMLYEENCASKCFAVHETIFIDTDDARKKFFKIVREILSITGETHV